MENSARERRPRLNLQAIESSLREVQHEFLRINRSLHFSREPMDDVVVDNLVSGYALVSQLLEARVELFALGNSAYLLELNTCVLCGTGEHNRREYKKYIMANYRRFYEHADAGIQDLYEWYALHRRESVWHRAAGIYIRILSEPQAFIEGNDRTGTLMMGYLLAKDGQPPFVLTAANARTYFDYSTQIQKMPRNSLSGLFRLHRLKIRIADFLKDQANTGYLL
jgi:hypothetical protein